MDIALADRIVTATAEALYVDKAPYPEALVLDWTDYCNAKCFFCYREKYEREIGGKGEFIPFEKLRKLEKVLSNIKFLVCRVPSVSHCSTQSCSRFFNGSTKLIQRY